MAAWAFSFSVSAQQPVPVGKGSYAEYTPLYKSRTDEHGGDQSRFMETRKIYITEKQQGLPVPTNDWWTDMLTTRYSGNLWTYPQMVKAEEYGLSVAFPKDWEATGHELKWASQIEILGKKFKPVAAEVDNWHDWGFNFQLNDKEKEMYVTLAHGIPFTWVETKNIELQIRAQNAIVRNGNDTQQTLPFTTNQFIIKIGNDNYGIYLPGNTYVSSNDGLINLQFSGNQQFISIAVLPSGDDLAAFAEYAYVIPRNTSVSWNYNETQGKVTTQWDITAENLKGELQLNVLQGFIPHHYKNSENNFSFLPYEYQTPRGKMKTAAGNHFEITYKFNGILPYFAAPQENAALQNPFQRERMKQLIADYADKGGFGADTYWGGKGLTQMALYMTFAHELGETELFEKCKSRLKANLINWLTYTPGENNFFFARFNHWGGLVGYDTSYDSDTFNDHHFHYGYFTYAAALLALFDEDFRTNYGEMISLIAKDYANWDKNDAMFPFFRTLDPWAGHSYAGGMGNNGNGQESTSEAMQGWGGLYMLGVATDNQAMRDAGIFGWTLEARGTAEYWFDRDRENIDYTRYDQPYSSNLTSQGVGWWTWFSGDPVWMHSIQWMPISPCLKYLYEDLDFARWDYTQMWNSKEVGSWTTQQGLPSSLSYESGLGNVVLSYLQIFDPDSAAAVFDTAWNANMPLAKNPDTGGISYFVTHSHRTYGDICWDIHGDISTSTVYKHPVTNQLTYVIYNSENEEKTIAFYQNNVRIQQIKVPAHKLTVYSDAPVLSSIEIKKTASPTVEPNKTLQLEAVLYDQYGAKMNGAISWSATTGGQISETGLFTAGNTKGVTVDVTAATGSLSATITLKINDKPQLASAQIFPQQQYLEVGKTLNYRLEMTNQYGDAYEAPVDWKIKKGEQIVKTGSYFDLETIGVYTVTAETEDQTYTSQVYLTPLFPNLALNKTVKVSSEENAGTLAKNATDGDLTTRWGSAHSDPQWIYVDLSSSSYISHVRIVWEASYSSLYEVQLSNSTSNWETEQTVSGGGGVEITEINRSARYVRILGRQRALPYGHSLYELEVYGVPPMGETPALFGIDLQPRSAQIKEGESVQLTVTGYDQFGNTIAVTPQYSVVSGTGAVTASGLFTPSSSGKMEVEAKSGNKTMRAVFIVEESLKLRSVAVSPKRVQLISGVSQTFSAIAKDQFGAEFPNESLVYRIESDDATLNGSSFVSQIPGNYEVIVGSGSVEDTAYVQVANIEAVNLAFMKPVTAGGFENAGTQPQFVNDGDYTTRWGSLFSDPQYIEIDLDGYYKINKINLFWETAYATQYKVEVSQDEENWITVFYETQGKGGNKTIDFEPVPARFVRLTTLQRFTQYGASLFEIEVFGTEYIGGTAIETIHPNTNDIRISMSNNVLTVENEQLQSVSVYDIQGRIFTVNRQTGKHFEQTLPQGGKIWLIHARTSGGLQRVVKYVL